MAGFNNAERVKKVKILAEEWLPDTEELTPPPSSSDAASTPSTRPRSRRSTPEAAGPLGGW